jgi:hypothetical protein
MKNMPINSENDDFIRIHITIVRNSFLGILNTVCALVRTFINKKMAMNFGNNKRVCTRVRTYVSILKNFHISFRILFI